MSSAKHCRLLVAFDVTRMPGREWALDEGDFEFDWVLTRTLRIPMPSAQYTFRRYFYVPLNLLAVLKDFDPDVVVTNELGLRTASAAAFSKLHKRPLIVWWERNAAHRTRKERAQIVPSTKAAATDNPRLGKRRRVREVPHRLGPFRVTIDLGMTGADTVRWTREVEAARGATRTQLREKLGLSGIVLVFVGRFIPIKGIDELLAAVCILAEDADLPAWSVLFVGSGPLESEIDVWAAQHPGVPVAMAGFVQPAELANYYAAADVFVMPSLIDRWALVCLEALAAGLPQVTSSLNGGAADLITSSEIGAIVDPRETRSLAGHLADQIRTGAQRVPELLRERAMTEWSPIAMAERAMSSIRSAIDDRSRVA